VSGWRDGWLYVAAMRHPAWPPTHIRISTQSPHACAYTEPAWLCAKRAARSGGGGECLRAALAECDGDDLHDGDVAVADEAPRVVFAADAKAVSALLAAGHREEVHCGAADRVQQRNRVGRERSGCGCQCIMRQARAPRRTQQLALEVVHLHGAPRTAPTTGAGADRTRLPRVLCPPCGLALRTEAWQGCRNPMELQRQLERVRGCRLYRGRLWRCWPRGCCRGVCPRRHRTCGPEDASSSMKQREEMLIAVSGSCTSTVADGVRGPAPLPTRYTRTCAPVATTRRPWPVAKASTGSLKSMLSQAPLTASPISSVPVSTRLICTRTCTAHVAPRTQEVTHGTPAVPPCATRHTAARTCVAPL
jgi:hypothetical protein